MGLNQSTWGLNQQTWRLNSHKEHGTGPVIFWSCQIHNLGNLWRCLFNWVQFKAIQDRKRDCLPLFRRRSCCGGDGNRKLWKRTDTVEPHCKCWHGSLDWLVRLKHLLLRLIRFFRWRISFAPCPEEISHSENDQKDGGLCWLYPHCISHTMVGIKCTHFPGYIDSIVFRYITIDATVDVFC